MKPIKQYINDLKQNEYVTLRGSGKESTFLKIGDSVHEITEHGTKLVHTQEEVNNFKTEAEFVEGGKL